MKLNNCLCCGTKTVPYLNLGKQPLANSYHDGTQLQEVFPLELCFCPNCTHNQLSVVVSPKKMFEDYLYVSETSKTLRDYFQWFAKEKILPNVPEEAQVLDIAGNTGYLMSLLTEKNIFTINVDPAKNLSKISKSRVTKHYTSYWNAQTANKITDNCGKCDIIVAMNVLGHVKNPIEFLLNCISCLENEGIIYIQTSQADMFLKNEFDTVYHEHISFFTAQSFYELAKSAKLNVVSFEIVPVHGGSFLIGFSPKNYCSKPSIPSSMELRINQEKELGIGTKEFHESFTNKCIKVKNDFIKAIDGVSKVVGYGAAAKGNTFLNFAQKSLDYIVDDNPNKIGLLCPGHNTIIKSPQDLFDETESCLVVIIAWNFFEEISNKIRKNSKVNHKFLTYFPGLKIE